MEVVGFGQKPSAKITSDRKNHHRRCSLATATNFIPS
jgi:hypothetical protein